jgi:hypothetical protein
MRMDYDNKWQYAVADIDWSSHVSTDDNTQALIQFSFGFEGSSKVVRGNFPIALSETSSILLNFRVSVTIQMDN